MTLNKCERCGCFFQSASRVCPNCEAKDKNDKVSLKNYLIQNDEELNLEQLSYHTGVSMKNLNRLLEDKKLSTDLQELGVVIEPKKKKLDLF